MVAERRFFQDFPIGNLTNHLLSVEGDVWPVFGGVTIFSRCMLVLGPEPGQEGRLWVTSRSRVPVDGATIASDVSGSSCREQ
ncbi:hypothetical protein AVEN_149379-1 [Araneus ventricosus]|uniref:Uncharacterized protein n=1 Tax=Araneus ventricosus TaxID=182803 RepID=A0A4Y2NQC9_ARAVE|nr:hypothetical protein AVEN_149379-1 [Araneus ventricosus]